MGSVYHEHPFNHKGQLIALGSFLMVWIVDSFGLHLTTSLTDDVPLYVRMIVTAIVTLNAITLFMISHKIAGHDQDHTELVRTGAFRFIRNPLYGACMLVYLGMAIATASLMAFGLMMPIFVFYSAMATYEERFLEERFGEAYKEYRRQTGKWIPKIGKNV